MITIENLSVSYGSTPVIDNLSWTLDPNKIHGLVGLNGAGKTTLLNAIYGSIKRDNAASILWNENPLNKKQIAYLETENFFYSGIKGKEYLEIFYSESDKKSKFELINQLFHLPLNDLIEEYSTGMKKKLAIFGMMLKNKDFLMLDEPYNGLDLESCKIVNLILNKQRQLGKTILVTSHIFQTLEEVCDEIHYLADKKIASSVTKENFHQLHALLQNEVGDKYHDIVDEIYG